MHIIIKNMNAVCTYLHCAYMHTYNSIGCTIHTHTHTHVLYVYSVCSCTSHVLLILIRRDAEADPEFRKGWQSSLLKRFKTKRGSSNSIAALSTDKLYTIPLDSPFTVSKLSYTALHLLTDCSIRVSQS